MLSLLTSCQKKVLELFSQSDLKERFYWSGGTLLASFYFQHRRSLDLDFFSSEPFSFDKVNNFILLLKEKLGFKKVRSQKIFDRWEFFLENDEPLRIEFVHYNGQKKALGEKRFYLGIKIDSLEDLAANKTMALLDRNEAKDLFDLYYFIKKGRFSPSRLLKLVEKKFGVKFDEGVWWGEVFKVLPLLGEIKPLMVQSGSKEKALMIEKIRKFFQDGSRRYLDLKLRG